MKKTLIIVLTAILTITAGCSPSDSSRKEVIGTEGIVIYNGLKNPDRPQPIEYLEYLESNKGIKVIPTPWDTSVSIQGLDGILKIDLQTYRAYFKDRHELFLSLNDILASNIYSSDTPAGIMNAVTDSDGNIWGFLISHDIDYYSRVYSEAVMEQLKIEMPKNPKDFKDFLTAAKDEMNMDGINVTADFCAQSFYDIFAYFDCHIIDSEFTIGWNEALQEFIDYTYTDEMMQSLQFIKELDKAGLVNHVMGDYNSLVNAFNINNTTTTVFTKGLAHDAEAKILSSGFNNSVFYLEYGSENIKYYFEYEYNCIYVVPINTTDAPNKVNKFIDKFYGDESLNKIGQWGIEGENFLNKSPELIFNTGYKYYYNPRLSGWWIENHYMRAATDRELDYSQFWKDSFWPEIKENYYNGVYQVKPIDKSIDYNVRNTGKNDLHTAFNRLLYKFIVDDMSVEAFIEEYTGEMKRLGAEAYIDSLNSGSK